MDIKKTRDYLEKQITKTEYHWINKTILNELVDKAVKIIEINLKKGNISEIDEEVMDEAAYWVIDELH